MVYIYKMRVKRTCQVLTLVLLDELLAMIGVVEMRVVDSGYINLLWFSVGERPLEQLILF